MSKTLFEAIQLGRIPLQNRIVMAPMTRSRANEVTDDPTAMMEDYYEQRASAGLIITEGVQPNPEGKGYLRTPGIYTEAQVAAWKRIVDKAHVGGASMVMQLMHCGRIGHPCNKAKGVRTIAPSAITAKVELFTNEGMQALSEPTAMTVDDIKVTIEAYRRATENAFAAGFDGVELHCTSGYLPAQFLSSGSNKRDDVYGGTLANRLRFVQEVLIAMASVDGADRIGLRICPANPFNDLQDDDPKETFSTLLASISDLGLAYLHGIHIPTLHQPMGIDVREMAKQYFKGPLIINESFSMQRAEKAITDNEAEAVSFGRSFIANPDLVARFKQELPLAEFDPMTLYSDGAEGYSSYPGFSQS